MNSQSCRQHQCGMTLVELMVTITVMAVLLAIAVPSFREVTLGSRLDSHANDFVASVRLARGEAIKRNAQVLLCASQSGTSCQAVNWDQGWIVVSGSTVLQRQMALPTGFRVTESSGVKSLVFSPSGMGITAAALTICQENPLGSQERGVTIRTSGATAVTKTSVGVCP